MKGIFKFLLYLTILIVLVQNCTKTKMYYGTYYYAPTWDANGTRIYYFRNDLSVKEITKWPYAKFYEYDRNTWYLCSCNANGGDKKEITKILDFSGENPTLITEAYVGLSFSPIEEKVVYELSVNGQSGIWILNLNNLIREQLTTKGRNPSWSHDGSRIAYCEVNEGIWIVDTTGINKILVCDFGWEPKWSPSEEWIVFGDSWNITGVWKIRPDGTDSTRLKDRGTNPVWNTTGEKIAYLSYGGIFMCDSNGLNEENISKSGGNELNWSLGASILFQNDGIWKLGIISGQSVKLLSDKSWTDF